MRCLGWTKWQLVAVDYFQILLFQMIPGFVVGIALTTGCAAIVDKALSDSIEYELALAFGTNPFLVSLVIGFVMPTVAFFGPMQEILGV